MTDGEQRLDAETDSEVQRLRESVSRLSREVTATRRLAVTWIVMAVGLVLVVVGCAMDWNDQDALAGAIESPATGVSPRVILSLAVVLVCLPFLLTSLTPRWVRFVLALLTLGWAGVEIVLAVGAQETDGPGPGVVLLGLATLLAGFGHGAVTESFDPA